MSHKNLISKEKPLLLDPCKDKPEKFFLYNPFGKLLPMTGRKKAQITINVFNLNETRLKNARKKKIGEVLDVLRLQKIVMEKNDVELSATFQILFDSMTNESNEFLGVVQHVINNPENFDA